MFKTNFFSPKTDIGALLQYVQFLEVRSELLNMLCTFERL